MIGRVELELLLRLAADPSDATWRRKVERGYPSAPRAGEWVYLDDEETEPRTVARVTWTNGGLVKLGFGTIDGDVGFEERLAAFGFTRDE
jgi:hypothetical protein